MGDSGGYDVFLSYSSPDRSRAEALAALLANDGRRVFWDQDALRGGDAYAAVIAAALDGARAVVVLFSKAASESTWVYAEAERARPRGSVIPARLDAEPVPLPFNALHVVDLTRFAGRANDRGVADLLDAVDRKLATSPAERVRRRLRRIRTGPGRAESVRSLVALALWIAAHLWAFEHLARGVALLLGADAVLGLALAVAHLRGGSGSALRSAALLWHPVSLGAELAVVVALAFLSSVRVAAPVDVGDLDVVVRGASGAPIRRGRIERGGGEFLRIVPALPFGRQVTIEATAHRPISVRLYPWRSERIGTDRLRPDPQLLLRLPVDQFALLSPRTRLRVLENGTPLGPDVALDESTGAVWIGGPGRAVARIDAARISAWRAGLGGAAAADVERCLGRWSHPAELAAERDVPLGARLTAVLVTRAGVEIASEPFSPDGRAFSDIVLKF